MKSSLLLLSGAQAIKVMNKMSPTPEGMVDPCEWVYQEFGPEEVDAEYKKCQDATSGDGEGEKTDRWMHITAHSVDGPMNKEPLDAEAETCMVVEAVASDDGGNNNNALDVDTVLRNGPLEHHACRERGIHNWGNTDFSSLTYQSQTAACKMGQIWDKITEVPTVMCQQLGEFADMFQSQPPQESFDATGDEMPGNRNKLVHQQGLVAKAEFIPEPGSPYTGIFQSGAQHMIIRMSETDYTSRHTFSVSANPSIGLKFLRDHQESANTFGMVSFEGTDTWDFLANDLMSQLPVFSPGKTCAPKTIGKFNSQATPFIFQVGNQDLASHTEDGTAVPSSDVDFPFFLRFKPRPGLPATDGKSRFFQQLAGDGDKPIIAGTTLWDVWALDEPNGTPTPWSTPQDEIKVGEIRTTSDFVVSLWGDEKLFFSHARLDEGFSIRPELRDAATPRFDEGTFGPWESTFSSLVPDASDRTIRQGIAVGCPFQFVIDALNF